MTDQSHLDRKYFIDETVYNCPFCNRNNIPYTVADFGRFDWSHEKVCYYYVVKCDACGNESLHLSYENLRNLPLHGFRSNLDLDNEIFYSQPTSFFTVDTRVPRIIRELITEAEGCRKMNHLTGASACTRKAIYELLVHEKVEGAHYDDKISALADKHPAVDPELFEVLAHIKDMTSDKVHEQSWDRWNSAHLTLILETLKTILHEMYVVPDEREQRKKRIRDLKAEHGGAKLTDSDFSAMHEKVKELMEVNSGEE